MTPDQLARQDEDNLKSLATGFRIVGGLCALCVNFAWIHVIVGLITMVGGNLPTSRNAPGNGAPEALTGMASTAFGGLFVFIGLTIILGGYAMGYYGFKAAKAMESRQHWKLCFGTSIAFLLFQPLGLILGILALIVLNRPSVRLSFSQS